MTQIPIQNGGEAILKELPPPPPLYLHPPPNTHPVNEKAVLNSFDPLKPHFYTVKLGFTSVYINFLFSAQET